MPTGPRPQPPDWTVRVAFNNLFQSVPWSNVMWLRVDTEDTPDIDAFNDYLDNIAQYYGQAFFPLLSDAVSGVNVDGTFFGAGSDAIDGSGFDGNAGDVEGAACPASVAACISWTIAAHYRGGHPRTYLCGIPDTATVNPTTLDPTFRASLEDAADTFQAAVNGNDLDGHAVELGTVSFVHLGDWRDPPIFRPYGTGATVDSRIDTQRRRLGPDR